MIATAACKRFLALVGGTACSATVHSVFDHAVNLELEGRVGLVGLIAETKALTPYAVSVRMDRPFSEAGIRAGMAAAVDSGHVFIPQADFELDCSKTRAVELSLDSISIVPINAPHNAMVEPLLAVLREADAAESLAPLATGAGGNVYSDFLAPRFRALSEAILADDTQAAVLAAERLAGCGAGLTPSSDDLLCGYLAAQWMLAREQGRTGRTKLFASLAATAAKKTTRISATFLLQCGEGLVNLYSYDLFSAIFTHEDEEATRAAARRVLAIGSTSGADMLTGVVLALQE
ncbi:MAG: DUF2877 domain-containing protein [Christensenella sp.]|nr:DUF2877 domain-containing protein [Christensenella sp.]